MLCQFARQFPPLVAEFLERGRQFKRRLREETVTDLMMVNLQNLGSDQIIVDFPDEPTTGADMEWNFVNRSNHTFYRLLLQAKCAYGNDALLSRHTYKYLSLPGQMALVPGNLLHDRLHQADRALRSSRRSAGR